MIRTLGALLVFLSLGLYMNNPNTEGGEELPCFFCKEEQQLYKLIMDYRADQGLAPIPLSNELVKVAHLHAQDLNKNFDPSNANCNAHSWSESTLWEPCCYDSKHSNPACMWDKPRELTMYEGNGYEIVVRGTRSGDHYQIKPKDALESWKTSSSHNQVILNKGVWKDLTWNAVGVAIEGNYASVWFGEDTDAQGAPAQCSDQQH